MRSLNKYDGRSGGSCCEASPCSMGMTADTSNLADRSAAAARRPVAAGSATPAKQVARRAAGAAAAAAAREARGQREPADMPAPAPQRAGASARIAAATRAQFTAAQPARAATRPRSGGASGKKFSCAVVAHSGARALRDASGRRVTLIWPPLRLAALSFAGRPRRGVEKCYAATCYPSRVQPCRRRALRVRWQRTLPACCAAVASRCPATSSPRRLWQSTRRLCSPRAAAGAQRAAPRSRPPRAHTPRCRTAAAAVATTTPQQQLPPPPRPQPRFPAQLPPSASAPSQERCAWWPTGTSQLRGACCSSGTCVRALR